MDKKELTRRITDAVNVYIDNFDRFDSNPQLRINPATFDVEVIDGRTFAEEIEDSDEAVENAAVAEGAGTKEATDFQVTQNPDFYAVRELLEKKEGRAVPSVSRIAAVVSEYFGG